MVDPSALITSLYTHIQTRLAVQVKNGAMFRQEIRPGAAEFAITATRNGPPNTSGGTRMTWFVEGYVVTHHAPDTLPTALLLAALRAASACESWWRTPVPQTEPGLLSWEVDAANIFVNPLTNSASGTSVVTVETGFTLLLDLEVA